MIAIAPAMVQSVAAPAATTQKSVLAADLCLFICVYNYCVLALSA